MEFCPRSQITTFLSPKTAGKACLNESRTGRARGVRVLGELLRSRVGGAGCLVSGMDSREAKTREARQGRGSLRVRARGGGGSQRDCLQLMATQMAFMALIYGALIVVELG